MISNVTSTASGTEAAQAAMKQSTGMNKDDFLKLFVTQLQNQDPLNPQDGTQFIGQLAQLTQVEQAYNTNTNLQNMLSQGTNSTTLAALTLIGKQVEAVGSQVSLTAGSSTTLNFNLDKPANQVTLSVVNGSGQVVKTLTSGAMAAGKGSLTWDGTYGNGAQAPSGAYSFQLSAQDATGGKVSGTPFIKGKIDAVDMSTGTPTLSIGNVVLSLTDVTTVSQGG